MIAKLYSILIEGQENQRIGFFQTFKVLSSSIGAAQNHVLMLKELEGKEPKVEEVEELDNQTSKDKILDNTKILEKTGRVFFNLSEEKI
jgi:hypothetical protein